MELCGVARSAVTLPAHGGRRRTAPREMSRGSDHSSSLEASREEPSAPQRASRTTPSEGLSLIHI
eukprot:13494001-Alexandrium_andersonii.AAC.1